MLTFFVIILSNIVIATIFYLIISLKLEKSASEYYSKKFRKEMDDVIREFNSTADRNISILENKITMLKKVLKQNGLSHTIDIKDEVKKEDKQREKQLNVNAFNEKNIQESQSQKNLQIAADNKKNNKNIITDVFEKTLSFFEKLNNKGQENKEYKITGNIESIKKKFKKSNESIEYTVDEDIKVDYKSITDEDSENVQNLDEKSNYSNKSSKIKNDQQVKEMFEKSKNVHGLLSELFEKGYSIETLSRCSQIPTGEVKLIVSLSNNI